ncbi:MAG TPA: ribonuclease III domain-containing protein [Methylomusa anaerophila]|uniref:Mini-ribonuclease 3 n=1 Tax=Methylomusa anaerophila TaxID=1930071 RepID=A0A348AJT2_9FIRM|nr:ribonuclease III domain-containing protein [Methylomusa anaerophila]BBB91330.1 mini-ribonuclease 3 [Methylomusa anaerophila]HML90495.1 ribonuclease III domain-containing protein [Methylomusa anaerophila]
MKFDHFRSLVENMFSPAAEGGAPPARFDHLSAERLHPLVLAYIGDAYFTLYVRTRLLAYEQNKVRVLHTFDARMVSAVMQAKALKALEDMLTEEERSIVRRGRNTKSTVPKSASIGEYRYSTGFEALLGFLFLQEKHERLSEIAGQAFVHISREMTIADK